MADSSYMHDADALAEPPAKRARFDGPSREPFERPSTPVDDTDDDDLYGETPVKASSPQRGLDEDPTSATSLPSESDASAHLALPGLGLLASAVEQVPDAHKLPQANGTTQKPDADAHQNGDPMSSLLQKLGADSKEASPVPPSVSHEAGASPKPTLSKADSLPEHPEQNVSADITAHSATLSPQTGHEALLQKDIQAVANEEEFRQVAEANKDNENAEWQLDSSADDSSSDSSSDDSSDSSSDEEGEVEDTVLDPEEQARILMEGDIDEEPATAEVLRTKNEAEEQYKKPDITITADMKITELGSVENVVDNLIVVKANISGEYQVLESGSLLCLGDRTVVGVVADTIGRVHAPLYSVGFPDPSDITAAGISKGTTVFYVDQHSKYVFTQPLKAAKYTDASNVHDEETNDVEFSDDEAEAEYKRNLKQAKRARADSRREDHPDDDNRAVRKDSPPSNPPGIQHQSGGLNYSDDDEDMGMYKPLTRPDHFEDIVGAGAPIEDRSHVRRNGPPRGNRGRGDRGRGHHGRGGRGDHQSPGRGRDRQRNRGGGGQHGGGQHGGGQHGGGQRGGAQRPQQQHQQQQHQPPPPQRPQQQDRNRPAPADNFRRGENRTRASHSPADKHRRQNRRENRNRTSRSPIQQRNPPPSARQRSPPRAPKSVSASSPAQSYSAPSNNSYSTASYANPQAYAWNQSSLPVAGAQTTQPQYSQYSQAPASSGGSIPAGAFVNPHFQQGQAPAPASAYTFQNPWQVPQQQAPQQQAATPNWAALAQLFQAAQQSQVQNQSQQQSYAPPQNQQANYAPPAGNAQPQQDPQAAFRAAQQQLELLRSLNRGQGPQ